MNERILELARQVWPDPNTSHVNHEKFAELIVEECLNQCYNRGMDDELYAGQLKAATYIEEYFGVEE